MLWVTQQLCLIRIGFFCPGPLASYKNRMQLSPVNNGPFGQYGGHLEFYCSKYLLWDAQGANTHNFVPWASRNICFETMELKMAALSPRRFEWRNRPRSDSNVAPRLSGQNCKFVNFLLSLNSQKSLRCKENMTKIYVGVRPESLSAALEYCYIESGLLWLKLSF